MLSSNLPQVTASEETTNSPHILSSPSLNFTGSKWSSTSGFTIEYIVLGNGIPIDS